MTKTQVKAEARKILDRLEDLRAELYDLRDETEDTASNIEPYEGYNDLTPEQEARQEWFESVYELLDECVSSVDDACSNLEEVDYE